jgi:hypothetical protein
MLLLWTKSDQIKYVIKFYKLLFTAFVLFKILKRKEQSN